MNCPTCTVYDRLVNDCIDPCFEHGPKSIACRQRGCPAGDTTTLQLTTQSVQADLLRLAGDWFIAIVVVVVGVLIGTGILVVIWLCRRRRRTRDNNRGALRFFRDL